jgi:hypothetical protein
MKRKGKFKGGRNNTSVVEKQCDYSMQSISEIGYAGRARATLESGFGWSLGCAISARVLLFPAPPRKQASPMGKGTLSIYTGPDCGFIFALPANFV